MKPFTSPEFQRMKSFHPLVTITTRLDPGLLNILGSAVHLSKAIMNLVSNATEAIHRIFEPFYTKKKMGRSGTGLGMAVVWGTVEDHRGYIDIQSASGKGTTVALYPPGTRQETTAENPTRWRPWPEPSNRNWLPGGKWPAEVSLSEKPGLKKHPQQDQA